MRKNKLQLELDKRYKRKYSKNKTEDIAQDKTDNKKSAAEAENIIMNDDDIHRVRDELYHNKSLPNTKTNNASPKDQIEQSISHLKSLVNLLSDNNLKQSQKDMMNLSGYDPALNFRFLQRQTTKNICLPQIRTRLKWQNGEYPFFRIETRYYNKNTQNYTPPRKNIVSIRTVSVQNSSDGSYIDIEYPQDIWPNKGQLYISNLRLLFKAPNKEDFYIPFENILTYSFYNNGVIVEHLKDNQKFVDVFFVDENQMRLLETVIHITI